VKAQYKLPSTHSSTILGFHKLKIASYIWGALQVTTYLRGVHQVANDPHGLVVDSRVLRSQHVDEGGQGQTLHDLVLVLLVFEGQRPQRTRRRSLHLHRIILQIEALFLRVVGARGKPCSCIV